MPKANSKKSNGSDSGLNFEAQLWAAADKMRGHMDASGYNGARPEGLCLGLIFLKYISDAFEEKREQLLFGFSNPMSEWFIKVEPQRADAAENPTLKGVLARDYARPSLDIDRLGGLVDIISNIGFGAPSPVASRHPLPSDRRGAGGDRDAGCAVRRVRQAGKNYPPQSGCAKCYGRLKQ